MKLDSVEWDWAPPDSPHLLPVEYTDNILLSPEDRHLRIYNLHEEHAGQYMCRLGDSRAPPYFLTVKNIPDEDLNAVRPENAPQGPYPQKPQQIHGTSLMLDTRWGPWSPCSTCGHIGKRHRLGYCIVIFASERNKRNTTVHDFKPQIPEVDLELLEIFKTGIPCKSHVMPKSIRRLGQVQGRKDEIMTGFCKVHPLF